jgi:thiol-disulfide isomerase/thioredoxin
MQIADAILKSLRAVGLAGGLTLTLAVPLSLTLTQAWAGQEASSRTAMAPEFVGISQWLNSAPLSMAQLRGKVVLVDFWALGCINCIRTLPYVQRWHQKYKDKGLVVVGVHTPEYPAEATSAALQAAVQRWGLSYAVAQDREYRSWNAWGTQYWPTLYLVNKEGRVVFRHIGEGDEDRIEAEIRRALQ